MQEADAQPLFVRYAPQAYAVASGTLFGLNQAWRELAPAVVCSRPYLTGEVEAATVVRDLALRAFSVTQLLFLAADLLRDSTSASQLVADALLGADRLFNLPSFRPKLVAKVVLVEVSARLNERFAACFVAAAFAHVGFRRAEVRAPMGRVGTGSIQRAMFDSFLLRAVLHWQLAPVLLDVTFGWLPSTRFVRWLNRKLLARPALLLRRLLLAPVGFLLAGRRAAARAAQEENEYLAGVPTPNDGLGYMPFADSSQEVGLAAASWHHQRMATGVVRAVIEENAIEYAGSVLREAVSWLGLWRAAWQQRRTAKGRRGVLWRNVVCYQVTSAVGMAVEISLGLAARVVGAKLGHRLLPHSWLGAYWGERAVVLAAAPVVARVLSRVLSTVSRASHGVLRSRAPTAEETRAEAAEEAAEAKAKEEREQQQYAAEAEAAADDDKHRGQATEELRADLDYYACLGVDKTAAAVDVKKAYRRLALQLHPDRTQHLSPTEKAACEAQMKAVNTAHKVLSDPQQRMQYDQIRVFGPTLGGVGGVGDSSSPQGKLLTFLARQPTAVQGAAAVAATFAFVAVAHSHGAALWRHYGAPGRGPMRMYA